MKIESMAEVPRLGKQDRFRSQFYLDCLHYLIGNTKHFKEWIPFFQRGNFPPDFHIYLRFESEAQDYRDGAYVAVMTYKQQPIYFVTAPRKGSYHYVLMTLRSRFLYKLTVPRKPINL